MAGTIELKDNGIEITNAPDEALMSLGVLGGYNPRAVYVGRDTVTLGYPKSVTYKVVGWDADKAALVLEKVS